MKLISVLSLIIPLTLSACTSAASDSITLITVTDHTGAETTLDKIPERIVSGYYITTSTLIALGLSDNIIGVGKGIMDEKLCTLAAPHILDLPNTGSLKEVDFEQIMALEPDLVILSVKLKDSAQTLNGLGIKTICVDNETPELLNEMIEIIGIATNTQDIAHDLIQHSNTALENLATTLDGVTKPTVYLAGNSDLLSTAGPLMYQHSLIENAGAINVASGITDNYWANISYEQLLSYDPEYIMITPNATYDIEDVLNNEHIQSLQCIQEQKVIKMPFTIEAWDSPVPSAYLGSLWLSSMLHSDIYSYEEFTLEVNEFYQTYYGFDTTV
ncbi:MAG: hypothetical protein BEN19_07830 [Epulopiscium sp. Nuni2H_MBin003]|nr:MAG: hypothetical protein BEN19_07830 [Epulopiscium sp. Nuni2H_MBin003]